tara:strand:- start:10470 stop:11084 length:615 start_codon:yes stop_codon:yes gene_type:complete
MYVLLGSNNISKQNELSLIFEKIPHDPITPQRLNINFDPPEVNGSHLEIAEQKALLWSSKTSYPVLSTDGGLIIPWLGEEWNSTTTKRNAGKRASDASRAQHLIKLLGSARGEDRQASWVETVAIAQSNQLLVSWEVSGPQGLITDRLPSEPISPFWVNHIWYFPQFNKTYHHMTDEEKKTSSDHWTQISLLINNFFKNSLKEL